MGRLPYQHLYIYYRRIAGRTAVFTSASRPSTLDGLWDLDRGLTTLPKEVRDELTQILTRLRGFGLPAPRLSGLADFTSERRRKNAILDLDFPDLNFLKPDGGFIDDDHLPADIFSAIRARLGRWTYFQLVGTTAFKFRVKATIGDVVDLEFFTTSPRPAPSGHHLLSGEITGRTAKGEEWDIAALQGALRAIKTPAKDGFFFDRPIDGAGGTQLVDALKAFQTASKLKPTGTVRRGDETERHLMGRLPARLARLRGVKGTEVPYVDSLQTRQQMRTDQLPTALRDPWTKLAIEVRETFDLPLIMTKAPTRADRFTEFELALGNGTFLTGRMTPRPDGYVPVKVANRIRSLAFKHQTIKIGPDARRLKLIYTPPKGRAALDLKLDHVLRHEVAVVRMADLPQLVRKTDPGFYVEQYNSAKDVIHTIRKLGFEGQIEAHYINNEYFAVITGSPAERLFRENQIKLKDPRLTSLQFHQYDLSPTRQLLRGAGSGVVFAFFIFAVYDVVELLVELVENNALTRFFIERGVKTPADVTKTIVSSAFGFTGGAAAVLFGASTGGALIIATATGIAVGSILNFVDTEFGFTDSLIQDIDDMLEQYRLDRIRPGNVIRLG